MVLCLLYSYIALTTLTLCYLDFITTEKELIEFCATVQVNLKEQGQLIRQDEFLVFFRKKKYHRHIFLFQDLILFSKTKKTEVGNNIYIYKQSFKVITPYTVLPIWLLSLNSCHTLKSNTKICPIETNFLYLSSFFLFSLPVQTSDIGMTLNCGDSGLCFEIWFRRRKSQDTYTLQARSSEVKEDWTKDLEKILWDQAIHNRGQCIGLF